LVVPRSMPTARAMMCCPPARKFGFVLESVSLNLMLERTRLNYARVVIVPKLSRWCWLGPFTGMKTSSPAVATTSRNR
jgi:hypothetical protein